MVKSELRKRIGTIHPTSDDASYILLGVVLGICGGGGVASSFFDAKISVLSIFAVLSISNAKVAMAPMVMVSPLSPSKKKL